MNPPPSPQPMDAVTRNPAPQGSGRFRPVASRSRPRSTKWRALFALAPVALLVACGDSEPEQDFYVEPETPQNPVAQTEAAAAELADRTELPTTSAIHAVSGSGASGRVTTTRRDGGLVVMIEAEGLPEEIEYSIHIHRGVCSEGGPVAVALDPVVGLADGTGASTTTLGPDDVTASEPLFVQIHGAGGAPIACGDLVEGDA